MLEPMCIALFPLLFTLRTIIRTILKKTTSNILFVHAFFLVLLWLVSVKSLFWGPPISPFPFYIICTCMEIEYAVRNADSHDMMFVLVLFFWLVPTGTAAVWLYGISIFLPNICNCFVQETNCNKRFKTRFQYGIMAFLGVVLLWELLMVGLSSLG